MITIPVAGAGIAVHIEWLRSICAERRYLLSETAEVKPVSDAEFIAWVDAIVPELADVIRRNLTKDGLTNEPQGG